MKSALPDHDEELLSYLDGRLNDAQTKALKSELETSPLLRARLELLRDVHIVLSKNKMEFPSPGFTQQVMNNLHKAPATSGLSPRNGLLLFIGAVVVIGLVTLLLSTGLFDDMNQPISFESLQVLDKITRDPIPSITFSGKLLMYGLIIINLGLAFILLDRTILKPWFGRRSRRLGVKN